MQGAAVGWGTPSTPDEKPLIGGIDLTIKRGQRILVLGPNGAGKSTFIKAVGGSLALWGGKRKLGDGVKISYFSQDLAQDLPITLEKCRAALGALGIQNSMALAKIGETMSSFWTQSSAGSHGRCNLRGVQA